MRDYKEDIKINEHDLESEWIEQASLFLYYASSHAEAIHLKDLQKSKCDYIYATMYSDIKKNWEKHFEIKPTEPAIKAHIESSKKYKIAERKFNNASKNVNLLLAVKTAFDHRKRALENLVSLQIGGFYSEPTNKTRRVNNLKEKGELKQAQKKALNKNKRK